MQIRPKSQVPILEHMNVFSFALLRFASLAYRNRIRTAEPTKENSPQEPRLDSG